MVKSSGLSESPLNIPLMLLSGPVSRTPSLWTSVMAVFHWPMLSSMNVISTEWILYIWRHLSIQEWGTLSKAFFVVYQSCRQVLLPLLAVF